MYVFIVQVVSVNLMLVFILLWLNAAGEFPPRRPSKRERRDQIEDDRKDGPLWQLR